MTRNSFKRTISKISLGTLVTATVAVACSGGQAVDDGSGGTNPGMGGALLTGGAASGASGAPVGGTGATAGSATGGAAAVGGTGAGTAGAPGGVGGVSGGDGGVAGSVPAGSGGIGAGTGGTGAGAGGTGTGGGGGLGGGGKGALRAERLDRGVVAVVVTGGVYVGWRMLGYEYDATTPTRISYNLYRNGALVSNVTNSTNFQDASGNAQSMYTVRAVIDGVEGAASAPVTPWAQNYLRVAITPPSSSYSANDATTGDADGDGVYEIYLKWEPNDAKDNSQAGVTGNVMIDCLKLDGTRLFRLDLGQNIRAGAHYSQPVVHDFDGDGKAELAVKTAPGTRDGTGAYLRLGPAANDTDTMAYRNADGYVLSGPEYLTVFNGQTGAELATVNFDVARGTVSSWGDDYGNRVDRFLSTAAYLDSTGLPSFVMARGYYTRTTMAAWNWRNGMLTQLWKFDSNTTPRDAMNRSYTGQGAHSMTVANVDSDPQLEIVYGAMMVDNNGMGLCSTGNNHGDALHAGDHIPSRPGIEVFMCNEDGSKPAHFVYDGRTCAVISASPVNGADTGRCVAGDVSPSNPGAEMWSSSVTGLFSATSNANVGTKPSQQNFLIYWDADESREIEDGTTISKFGGGSLLSCSQCASNNGTKSTPTLTADLLGDWREEIIWRESNNTGLRLYTTTAVTARRIYTLMHDPQYRMQVSAQQTAYNQPPHPGFHIGNGMVAPPAPDINVP